MIASEAQPFSKTGGLADVATALPKALATLGHDVTLITPRYRGITDGPVVAKLSLEVAAHRFDARLMEAPLDGLAEAAGRRRVLLLDCPELYDRNGIYYDAHGDFGDNAVRYAFLSAAAIEFAAQQAAPLDVVHSHDWQGGLAPVYARRLGGVPTVFTIHNLAYQGLFPSGQYPLANLPWEYFTAEGIEFYGRMSCLKAGLVFADVLTTVSPRYAREILTPELGCGLDGLLRTRESSLFGILNGSDYELWNPTTDPHIQSYSRSDLTGKTRNKELLQKELGLPVDSTIPLFGNIGRLVEQKGVDVLLAALPEIMRSKLQFVLLGNGTAQCEQTFQSFATEFPT